MHYITIPQMQQVIEHIVVGKDEPCWFHGEPGCGKSEGANSAARTLDAQLIDFRLGQYDTVDFKGFPDVDRATNTTVWYMASTLPFIGNHKFDPARKKIVFLDEADHGKESVKGVAYQMLQERRVGEHVFQPNTFFMAAGNRPQDRGVGGKNPPPLNNRCTHYGVGPDAQAWTMWAATQPDIPGTMLAFLQFRPSLISNFDPKATEPAFATPRTITKACHYDIDPNIPEDIKDASIEGATGEAFAAEYRGFKRIVSRMPSIKSIIANPLQAPVFDEPEIRWAIAVGIAGELSPDTSAAGMQYLDRMDPEFGILAWQLALKRNEQLIGTKEFISMSVRHQAIFAQVNRGI